MELDKYKYIINRLDEFGMIFLVIFWFIMAMIHVKTNKFNGDRLFILMIFSYIINLVYTILKDFNLTRF